MFLCWNIYNREQNTVQSLEKIFLILFKWILLNSSKLCLSYKKFPTCLGNANELVIPMLKLQNGKTGSKQMIFQSLYLRI